MPSMPYSPRQWPGRYRFRCSIAHGSRSPRALKLIPELIDVCENVFILCWASRESVSASVSPANGHVGRSSRGSQHQKSLALYDIYYIHWVKRLLDQPMTTRHCFALDLHDDADLIARYEKWHQPGQVPVAVTRSIRKADIRDMEIWRAGTRLLMIMETGPGFSPEAKADADLASADVQAWERLMWEFQKPLTFANDGEKWVPMKRIFALGEQGQ